MFVVEVFSFSIYVRQYVWLFGVIPSWFLDCGWRSLYSFESSYVVAMYGSFDLRHDECK